MRHRTVLPLYNFKASQPRSNNRRILRMREESGKVKAGDEEEKA
uniref:Uncharacterized protein n=1 Tax=Rhizophora mucronata TaxID=61149 RepID=A0A2P2PJX2_RHIMU